MPIPNVSTLYQKIASGAEGGLEFARILRLLLHADFNAKKIDLVAESDASGDYKGLDAYVVENDEFPDFIRGFQFKFYSSKLSQPQKREIILSIEKARQYNEFIQEFVLITPEDFMKEQLAWFGDLKAKYEELYWVEIDGLYRKSGFKLTHWGHSRIIELFLKHEHIGRNYYPELFPFTTGKFTLSKAKLDCKKSKWKELHNYSYFQIDSDDNKLTLDPVFDFQFINNTNDLFLLDNIEIQIESISTTLRGFRSIHVLKSVGVFEYRIDFNKNINRLEFDDPLILKHNKPFRFHLQLIEFTKDCPGNNAKIKFWFHFRTHSVPTESFSLSF